MKPKYLHSPSYRRRLSLGEFFRGLREAALVFVFLVSAGLVLLMVARLVMGDM